MTLPTTLKFKDMNYYTEIIPVAIAEKLKEKGMHQLKDNRMEGWLNSGDNITYAEVFDWLMEKGLSCEITRHIDFADEEVCPEWDWDIEKVGTLRDCLHGYGNTWHKAANAAIEKALTLI